MDRLALVIGNSDYTKVGKLNNPQNDANDMEKVLQKLNFDVTKLINATLNDPSIPCRIWKIGGP